MDIFDMDINFVDSTRETLKSDIELIDKINREACKYAVSFRIRHCTINVVSENQNNELNIQNPLV